MNFAVVGAGFTGAVLANILAENGHNIDIFDSRNHIGGNCYTERDSETNIMVHKYGPHIFHTDNSKVWSFVNSLSEFVPFVNRVKLTTGNEVFSMPINLHTINQFFKKTFSPIQAETYLQEITKEYSQIEPLSFEDQALKFIGKDLYNAFFKEYTIKQWGITPAELPASILKRLPLRFNYDDNYFNHTYQGIPRDGYTPIFEKLLDNNLIRLHLGTKFSKLFKNNFSHVFYTGPIDAWFDYRFGRLGYRTLDFKSEIHTGDFQGCAVMNYPELKIPFTRITEHKYFTPWESYDKTIIFKEYSRLALQDDIPYYPIRQIKEKAILKKYISVSLLEKNVSFMGRLGTYRYIDMDKTIEEALNAAELILNRIKYKKDIDVFFVNPL